MVPCSRCAVPELGVHVLRVDAQSAPAPSRAAVVASCDADSTRHVLPVCCWLGRLSLPLATRADGNVSMG